MDFDYLSLDEKRSLHQKLLYRLFLHAKCHPLTKNRLEQIEGTVTEANILSKWQHILPEDTSDHKPLLIEQFSKIATLNRDRGSAIVISSGGTQGAPLSTCLSFDEIINNCYFQGKGYFTAGIQQNHTVATFGIPSLLSSEFTVYHGLKHTACLILPIGISDDPEKIVSLIEDFAANVLLVMPSDLIPIIQYLDASNKKLDRIKLIVTGGEKLREDLVERITSRIGIENLKLRSTFQTSDTGSIGFQCDSVKTDAYHIHEELQLVEIIKDEDDDNCLVVTNLNRYLFPVIRLKTGDIAEWADMKECPCGRKSRIIKLKGRKSRYIKIGGEKFDQEVLHSIPFLFKIPIEACAWRLRITNGNQEEFVFKIHSDYRNKINGDTLKNELNKGNSKFSHQSTMKIISELKIEELNSSDVVYSASGKRKFLIDERT
ncbi:MAG: phenylacetate--CoA ligase family protein [Deltaproteobacteria bacterium]|nr:phenylacetate--CoA ligase family protein [Deltaproteobacteria bacterium]